MKDLELARMEGAMMGKLRCRFRGWVLGKEPPSGVGVYGTPLTAVWTLCDTIRQRVDVIRALEHTHWVTCPECLDHRDLRTPF